MATTYRSRRRRSKAWTVGYVIGQAMTHLAFDFLYALLLALPVMWLTAFLADCGSPLQPLGYWASVWTAFLLSWIIDGAGTVRRAIRDDK
jgi:hypothetical protein